MSVFLFTFHSLYYISKSTKGSRKKKIKLYFIDGSETSPLHKDTERRETRNNKLGLVSKKSASAPREVDSNLEAEFWEQRKERLYCFTWQRKSLQARVFKTVSPSWGWGPVTL